MSGENDSFQTAKWEVEWEMKSRLRQYDEVGVSFLSAGDERSPVQSHSCPDLTFDGPVEHYTME